MLRQKAKVTQQRRKTNQIVNVQTRKLSLIDKEETLAKYQMYRQKTIINRQRRNVSQIANVQRKSQTDRQIALQTHSKISTKFALQTRQSYRQIYRQNSHDEEVDKVQRKYRLNSPCKCNAIDNIRLLRNRNGLLRNRKTRNFFVVKLHLSYPQRLQTP